MPFKSGTVTSFGATELDEELELEDELLADEETLEDELEDEALEDEAFVDDELADEELVACEQEHPTSTSAPITNVKAAAIKTILFMSFQSPFRYPSTSL